MVRAEAKTFLHSGQREVGYHPLHKSSFLLNLYLNFVGGLEDLTLYNINIVINLGARRRPFSRVPLRA